ncbi:two-component system regulatory protein YycI [Heyndrickxia sp. NPDC080065]|uniref:two-component system regulatory protein YycI n=1 Tax=Heyndrickxia sp. NPDC080065 TaxID=3390568 RepID=UPI003D014326
MDWNKTKSMFIFVFLILDIFLLVQFRSQYMDSKIETLKGTSLEDKLEDAKITYDGSLPPDAIKSQYVSAKTKTFSEEETKDKTDQVITIGPNKTTLLSTFKKPIKLKSETDQIKIQLESILKGNILFGDQYKFWKYDKEQKIIVFYQTFEDKMFFRNKSGCVLLHVNDKNEVDSYKQTLLEKIEKRGGEKVIAAITAIGNLYDKHMLLENSKIKSAELGYYTLIEPTETQMLVPTWHFVVDHNGEIDDLYVNAIEGRVIPKNETME